MLYIMKKGSVERKVHTEEAKKHLEGLGYKCIEPEHTPEETPEAENTPETNSEPEEKPKKKGKQ